MLRPSPFAANQKVTKKPLFDLQDNRLRVALLIGLIPTLSLIVIHYL